MSAGKGAHGNGEGRIKDLRARRRFVRELRRFGEDHLGLGFDDSFRKYDPGLSAAHWLYSVYPDRFVSAHDQGTPFRFTWKLNQARAWERGCLRKGLHTYLYSAEAHGGTACPITPGLLRASRVRQAYVVLHEAWHATLRREQICMPYALEEATGRVVGVMGAVQFARIRGDDGLERAARSQAHDWQGFARWINRSYRRLDRLYRRAAPPHPGRTAGTSDRGSRESHAARQAAGLQREVRTAWAGVLAEADRLRARTRSTWEREELTRPVNNAFLYRYYDYTRYYPLALRTFARAGSLTRAMALYRRAGEEGAPAFLRRAAR